MNFKSIKKTPALFLLVMILLVGGLLTMSCYKDYGMSTEDYDLIAAFYDKDTDFTKIKTYILADSIEHIVEEGKEDDITRKFDEQILEQIDVNMKALGYTKIEQPSESQKPDVLIPVLATSQTNRYVWGWFPSYPWYPGWGPYPPGWWYPWYPSYGVSSYRSGTVLWAMVDPDEIDPETDRLTGVWVASVDGLLDDSDSNIRKRLTTSINEAFRISPYLVKE